MRPSRVRRTFPRAGAYARDVRPPSRVCKKDVGELDEGFLCASGVDSRYVNARFQITGRPICVTAECECVSRSIPDGKGEVGEDAPREAWPRALSQYGASWASCFDGGFAAIASNTELAVSRASSDSKESKDVRWSYAACERYGCESFGREQ